MKGQIKIVFFVLLSAFLISCSHYTVIPFQNVPDIRNPLKTEKDIEIEQFIIRSTWEYVPQEDDCKDTKWYQSFYKNRYYESVGDACSIPKALSVDTENWYIKNKHLYMTNLSPINEEDIVLKYLIIHLDHKKLVLQKGKFKYIFIAINKKLLF